MPEKHDVHVRIQRPGFMNRLSDFAGSMMVLAISAIIVIVFLSKLLAFLWPTLTWLVPLLLFLAFTGWLFYKTVNLSDEKAREFYNYKMNIALVRVAVILFILFVDIKTVG
ncbi:MAG: hypothetical protein QG653_500 [Patescibacteria group bacterium]|nr:hypothetical protein [Patescibacteria group bacterium]